MSADRDAVLLGDLLRKLRDKHFARISRSLGATVSAGPLSGGAPGEFEIVITPLRPVGAAPISVPFRRVDVFGASLQLSKEAHAVQRKPCDYANDVIRFVLQKRKIV